ARVERGVAVRQDHLVVRRQRQQRRQHRLGHRLMVVCRGCHGYFTRMAPTPPSQSHGWVAVRHKGVVSCRFLGNRREMVDLTLTKVVSDPFVQTGVAAVVGAVVTSVMLRRYPARRLALQAAFFLLLTLLLFYHGIVPYEVASDGTPAFERICLAVAKV